MYSTCYSKLIKLLVAALCNMSIHVTCYIKKVDLKWLVIKGMFGVVACTPVRVNQQPKYCPFRLDLILNFLPLLGPQH